MYGAPWRDTGTGTGAGTGTGSGTGAGVPRVVSLLFDLSVCLCRPECLSVTGLRFLSYNVRCPLA